MKNLSPDMLDSIGEHVDGQRAGGRSYGEIAARLRGPETPWFTEGRCREIHLQWQEKDRRATARRERRETVLMEEVTPGAVEFEQKDTKDMEEEGEADDPLAGAAVPEAVWRILRFLAGDLVDRAPEWHCAGRPSLGVGESYEVRKGPGSALGVEWVERAVVILKGGAVVRVYPDHRLRKVVAPESRHNSSVRRCRPGKVARTELRLEVLSFESPTRMKMQQKFREGQAALKKGKLSPRARQLVEWQLERLEGKLSAREQDGGKVRLKVEQMMNRLATILHLYLPQITGIRSGAELGKATQRTRAAVSAQGLVVVEQDTRATGGRAGFEGKRAAGRHREKVRAKALGGIGTEGHEGQEGKRAGA